MTRPTLAFILISSAALLAQGGATFLVSADAQGGGITNVADLPALSGDGRFAAFSDTGDGLLASDVNGRADVFVKDLVTGGLEIVSLTNLGAQGTAGSGTMGVAISGDGRYVAFTSGANLDPATGAGGGIFVRDRQAGVTERVSFATAGQFRFPDISADGRFVVYTSGVDANVFVYDRMMATTTLASPDLGGGLANCLCRYPAISDDGRYVVFASCATDVFPGLSGFRFHVYRRDLMAGVTELVSVDPAGQPGNAHSGHYPTFVGSNAISGNGRFVAFRSQASNLVLGDGNAAPDLFVRDLQTGTTTRISEAAGGGDANGSSRTPALSADGRYVGFTSTATNLSASPAGGNWQAFWHDRMTGETRKVSISAIGQPAVLECRYASVSDDGARVAFACLGQNLVPGTPGNVFRVFAHDVHPLITLDAPPTLGTSPQLTLAAPPLAGQPYVLAASSGWNPGMSVDLRFIPLNPDPLIDLSLSLPGVFPGFVGTLDASGGAVAGLNIPPAPALAGFSFVISGITGDLAAPSGVSGIFNALVVTLQP